MALWAPFALVGTTAAMLALPVAPALHELWSRQDAGPLPTSRHDGNIASFAEVFRLRLEPLRPELERCVGAKELTIAEAGGTPVLLVGSDSFVFHPHLTQSVSAIMCGRPATVPAARVVEADIFAREDLRLGCDSVVRAALAGGDVVLERNSVVLRWLHADGRIELEQGSCAFGRMSARHSIRLHDASRFERMRAPEIFTGDEDPSLPPVLLCDGNSIDVSRPRIRRKGHFVLPAGETLSANVVSTGQLHLLTGSRVIGSTKSYGTTLLERGCCVEGSVVCSQSVEISGQCSVGGPIMAESGVVIGPGTRVGSPDAPTTISARHVRIAPGCVVYWAVWARVSGVVES